MHTIEEFALSGWSLAIYSGDQKLFCSRSTGIAPLVEYLGNADREQDNLTIFDKYVGRAAALLMTHLKPVKVFAGVISDGAVTVFDEYMIPYEAGRQVQYLMNVASEDMCRFEKMSLGKTPGEFLEEIRSKDIDPH